MVFSSSTFLFIFLPVLLAAYLVTGKRLKNPLLLGASLCFYAWGEAFFVLVMLASIAVNYVFGILIDSRRGKPVATVVVSSAIAANLVLLISFKYANFIAENVNLALGSVGLIGIDVPPIHLPIGISFFTFQAISYVIDIYRGRSACQRNPVDLALYISLFPQLIAGPIVRYHDIADQLRERHVTSQDFSMGVRRFIAGFAKKMIIANPLGEVADQVFALPAAEISPGIAWLGIVCYTLQIFFDFSGYSDMAIGLGRMFGFRFLENFNYPYIAKSIQDFWRRWHISLSNWFRDYLYIPLGGNRRGNYRTYFNLVVVFVLCGLWHGASWNFLIWGLIHGAFLVVERLGLDDVLARLPGAIRYAYVLFVAMIAWVFFRAESLPDALAFLEAMFGLNTLPSVFNDMSAYYDNSTLFTLALGIALSTPILPWLAGRLEHLDARNAKWGWLRETSSPIAYLGVMLLAMTYLAAGTYNPFIYFRF